jgi:hypothetical protein
MTSTLKPLNSRWNGSTVKSWFELHTAVNLTSYATPIGWVVRPAQDGQKRAVAESDVISPVGTQRANRHASIHSFKAMEPSRPDHPDRPGQTQMVRRPAHRPRR